ncbi:MAG: hypothetical protein AB7G25_02700 [Sphingomonadaceae bacterium]
MENDLLDLADRLRTVAGMIMEDNHLTAVSVASDTNPRDTTLDTLAAAGSDIAILMAAAKVLVKLG